MTETEFRLKFSELIEYYQYIEERLKYICATLLADEEKGWFDKLDEIDSDPFGMLITKIQSLQTEKQINILNQDDFDALNDLRSKRNFWVHQCFSGIKTPPVIFKKDELKNQKYGKKVQADLIEAIEWEQRLVEKLWNAK